MSEETSEVAELALLEAMHLFVLTAEQFGELLVVDIEEVAEPLANVPVEGKVGTILRAALDDHIAQFDLLARSDGQLEQLVAAFFEIDSRHDDQVDRLPQLDQVLLRDVFDLLLTIDHRCFVGLGLT